MRGWVFRSRGTPAQVLKLENDLPQPTAASLGPHDVLIKVKYAALFQGMAAMMTQIPHFNNKPWVAETAFSGVVVSTGDQVEHVKADDSVFGGLGPDVFMKYGGVLAEYIVLPDQVVVRKPSNISFEGAGGIGAGGITAMQFMGSGITFGKFPKDIWYLTVVPGISVSRVGHVFADVSSCRLHEHHTIERNPTRAT